MNNPSSVLHFAEFGVVMMLFLVGLELEPRRLWSLRKPIFIWGTAQVVVSTLGIFGLFFVASVYLGSSWQVMLVAALGLSLSSTAIALQVINERGSLSTHGGQLGFAVLLFQDMAAIPILALIPLLVIAAPQLSSSGSGLAQLAMAVVAIAAIVVAGRLLVRPALRWIANSKTHEIFTAASLFLVFAIAALMQAVGLSMALGAFLAGVLLSESEFKHELESNIEPFKGLLLGLFFIAVGMNIDFGVIIDNWRTVLFAVVGFMLVKAVLIWLIIGRSDVPAAERPVLTLLLAQGGEFAFVVFQAAQIEKVFSAAQTSILVAAVGLSMLISPLLLIMVDAWVRRSYNHKPAVKTIDSEQTAPVIIAGFGRYGQMVGRVLLSQNYPLTVLDGDADMIESARQFGYRVFYGDASRLDLLRLAGADSAKVLVVAVNSRDNCNKIVTLAQMHFPHLHLSVRAFDATHAYELMDMGVTDIQREVFESSLSAAHNVLTSLGHNKQDAKQIVKSFRRHNFDLMKSLHIIRKDRDLVISHSKQHRADLQQQMASESLEREQNKLRTESIAKQFGLPTVTP